MPSHLEGLCSTLIDAMFAGAPIVATTAGGIPEVLGDHGPANARVAILVPPRDPVTLATALNNALTDLPALRAMAERAKLRAEQHFTAQRMVEETIAVYGEVLASAAPHLIGSVRSRAA